MRTPELPPSVVADLADMDRLIGRRLRSEVALVNTVADYIVGAGGKRLRPVMLLLSARALGYGTHPGHAAAHHVLLATVVEFIHTATLLHDDVVDESELRRGRRTANAAFGNAASVLVGDFLYSRAFQMMVEVDRMRMRLRPETQEPGDITRHQAAMHLSGVLHWLSPASGSRPWLAWASRRCRRQSTGRLCPATGRLPPRRLSCRWRSA